MHTFRLIYFPLNKWASKVALAGILSLTLVLLVTSNVFAYHLEGPRWYGTPNSGCCANVLVNVQGSWHSNDTNGRNGAVNAWNGSPANVLLSQTNAGALTIAEASHNNVGWDGITYYAWSGAYFSYAHIYVNYYYTSGYPAGATQGVIAHELGHALGLAHTNGCVLMTPATSERWFTCHLDTPQGDDINGINRLY